MAQLPTPSEIAWMKAHADDTRVPSIIATTSICGIASTVFVLLRFISRRMARLKPQLNDWLLVVALVSEPDGQSLPALRLPWGPSHCACHDFPRG